jgi:hypothetical protein
MRYFIYSTRQSAFIKFIGTKCILFGSFDGAQDFFCKETAIHHAKCLGVKSWGLIVLEIKNINVST